MVRTLTSGLAILVMYHGPADAQSTGQGGGQYVQTQPHHKAKVQKVDAFTLKQSTAHKGPGNVKWKPIRLKR